MEPNKTFGFSLNEWIKSAGTTQVNVYEKVEARNFNCSVFRHHNDRSLFLIHGYLNILTK